MLNKQGLNINPRDPSTTERKSKPFIFSTNAQPKLAKSPKVVVFLLPHHEQTSFWQYSKLKPVPVQPKIVSANTKTTHQINLHTNHRTFKAYCYQVAANTPDSPFSFNNKFFYTINQ